MTKQELEKVLDYERANNDNLIKIANGRYSSFVEALEAILWPQNDYHAGYHQPERPSGRNAILREVAMLKGWQARTEGAASASFGEIERLHHLLRVALKDETLECEEPHTNDMTITRH